MQEFLYLSYTEDNRNKISIEKMNSFMKSKGYSFNENTSTSNIYNYSHKFQYSRIENGLQINISNLLIKGSTTGIYPNNEIGNLKAEEILSIIQSADLLNSNLQFEGSLSYLYELGDSIIFQNDIEGFRKIFYYIDKGIICVSSFMPLILLAIRKDWFLNSKSVLRFFSSRESMWPSTLVDGISVLEPKSKALVSNNEIKITNYTYSELFDLKKKPIKHVESDLKSFYFKQLSYLFNNNNCLMSLSGGFDSSNLLSFVTNFRKKDVHAISIGYQTNRLKDVNLYNETNYAENIANYYNVPISKYIVEKDKFFESFESLLEIIDQPAVDPSSFNLMSILTKREDKTALVSAMGGDALFSSKISGKLYLTFYNIACFIPEKILKILVKLSGKRGPFNAFSQIYKDGISAKNPFVAIDRLRISTLLMKFYLPSSFDLMEDCRKQQLDYWNNIFLKSKTKLDILYSFAALSNPDEYHAYTVAERQGVLMYQPLIKINSVIEVLNASNYYSNINSRKFLCRMFGVNKNLLYKGKSGFSIPYADWCKEISEETFEFWYKNTEISNLIDLKSFHSEYLKNFNLHSYSIIVWKMYVLMRYMERYSLRY
jgi:hypothetical protein